MRKIAKIVLSVVVGCLGFWGVAVYAEGIEGCTLPSIGSGFFNDTSESKKAAVLVFVHGVTGNAIETWKSGDYFWPCLIKGDADFKDADIFLYDYQTDLMGGSQSISSIAENLENTLISKGVNKYARIAFVAHSMGGLIVEKMLSSDGFPSNFLDRIKFVSFYATPGAPSSTAYWATFISKNQQFKELDDPNFFLGLNKKWASRLQKNSLKVFCVSEDSFSFINVSKWFNSYKNIVSLQDASISCQPKSAQVAYGSDHSSIVKPKSQKDFSYNFLSLKYSNCILGDINSKRPKKIDNSDAEREGIQWLERNQKKSKYNKNNLMTEADLYNDALSFLGNSGKKFFYPKNGNTSFQLDRYDHVPYGQFRQEVQTQLVKFWPQFKFEFATTVSGLYNMLNDGLAFEFSNKLANSEWAEKDNVVLAVTGTFIDPVTKLDSETQKFLLFLDTLPSTLPDGVTKDQRLRGYAWLPSERVECK